MEDNHFVAHPDGGIAVKSEAAPAEEKVEETKPEAPEEIAENRTEGEAKPEGTQTPAEEDAEKTEGEE